MRDVTGFADPRLQRWLPVLVLPPILLLDGALSSEVGPIGPLAVVSAYVAVLPLALRAPRLHCYSHPMLQREVCGADLAATLRRSDFGMTDGLPFIGALPRGVCVVTAFGPDGPAGMTASSVSPLSLEPAVIVVGIRAASRTLDASQRTR